MARLNLYFPIKPFNLRQAWGIYNPAYSQFGFDHHNGCDLALNGKLRCPVRMKIVLQNSYPNGGGNMVEAISTDTYTTIDDKETFILFAFMHNASFIHQIGDVLEVGDEVAIPDNTGFSTGPHCHFGAYRCNQDGSLVDTQNLSFANGSFDPQPFFNGQYAEDIWNMKQQVSLYQKVVEILKQLLKLK